MSIKGNRIMNLILESLQDSPKCASEISSWVMSRASSTGLDLKTRDVTTRISPMKQARKIVVDSTIESDGEKVVYWRPFNKETDSHIIKKRKKRIKGGTTTDVLGSVSFNMKKKTVTMSMKQFFELTGIDK